MDRLEVQGPVAYRVGVSGRHLVYDVFAVTRGSGGLLDPHGCRRSLHSCCYWER